jgi:(E)-4-hydroxy-3-methylbut-2-enyl-diphosphate synthase
VKAAQELLQTMGFRTFVPLVAAVPRLRPHHLDGVPGSSPRHPELDSTSMPDWSANIRASRT